MNVLKAKIGKIVTSVLGFFGIMTFTSCYGSVTPAMYGVIANYNAVQGTVTGDTDGDNKSEPVQGIKVAFKSADGELGNEGTTDENGKYYIEVYGNNLKGNYTVEFSDVDGDENGSFEGFSQTLAFSGAAEVQDLDVELKTKAKGGAE